MVFYAQSQTVEDDANTNEMLKLLIVHQDICSLLEKGKILFQRYLSCPEHFHYWSLWSWADNSVVTAGHIFLQLRPFLT